MRYLITKLLLLVPIYTFSQTVFYTTDGQNRVNEAEAYKMLSEKVSKASEERGIKFYGSLTVVDTETKKDSIISKITFALSTRKFEKRINIDPMLVYKEKVFPKFNLMTLNGKNFNSEQLKGKPTMINFWFTNCKPCIDEMPVLNKIKVKYKNEFNFIAITWEEKEDVKNFLKKHSFEFEHLINARDFTNQIVISSYPKNLFLDKNGVLRYIKGGIPYERKEGEELKIGEGNEFIEIIEKLK